MSFERLLLGPFFDWLRDRLNPTHQKNTLFNEVKLFWMNQDKLATQRYTKTYTETYTETN